MRVTCSLYSVLFSLPQHLVPLQHPQDQVPLSVRQEGQVDHVSSFRHRGLCFSPSVENNQPNPGALSSRKFPEDIRVHTRRL